MRLCASSVVGVLGRSMLLIFTALHANLVAFFPSLVTLSSHGSFISCKLVSAEENAINWDIFTVLEDEDVANTDEVVVHVTNYTVT